LQGWEQGQDEGLGLISLFSSDILHLWSAVKIIFLIVKLPLIARKRTMIDIFREFV
jgi:hypothetical protein